MPSMRGAKPTTNRDLRDLRLILAVQAIRAFLYGFGTGLLGTAFAREGLCDVQATLVLTSMLIGMALTSIVVGLIGRRARPRRAHGALRAARGAAGAVSA